MTDPLELLTKQDVARLLSVTVRTVERMRAAGRLLEPAVSIGHTIRWRADDLRRWIRAGCPDPDGWG